MTTDTKTPAKDAAGKASITSAINSKRTERLIFIYLPLAFPPFAGPMLLCRCGLRGGKAQFPA
jgi:hypothetical protein